MSSRLLRVAPLLLVSQLALAAPQGSVRPLPPTTTVNAGDLKVRTLAPNLDVLAAQVAQLTKDLKATQTQLAATQSELTEHKKDFTFLTTMVNGMNQRLLTHRHPYTYRDVKYWNRQFVTSGRPIVEHEKRDYGSWIEALPTVSGMTAPPDLATK